MSTEAEKQNKEAVDDMINELESPTLESEEEEEEESTPGEDEEEEEFEEDEDSEEEEEIEDEDLDEDSEEEEEEDEDFDDLDDLDEDEDDLKNEVKELRKTVASLIKQKGEEDSEEDEEEISLEDTDIEFVTDEEYEEALTSKEAFNNILKKVFNQAREFSLREGANVVSKKILREQSVRQSAREFYQENPELLKHKEYVAVVANQVASKYPDKGIDFIYGKTAKVVRKRLNIKKKAADTEEKRKKGKRKTAFAKKPGSSASKRKSSKSKGDKSFEEEQKSQIDGMIDELGV